jgi:TolB-like protein
MGSSDGGSAPSGDREKPFFRAFLQKLRKRRIIETLAAFIGGGWLLVEVAERLLVGHYKFPDETIDVTVVSVIGALLSTLIWRWFRGTEKRPGNVKVEVLLVPLLVLATVAIDLNIVLRIAGISDNSLPIGVVAFLVGVAWIVYRSIRWAAAPSTSGRPEPAVSSQISAIEQASIAVLPFENLSPDPDNAFFADGLTEELISDLSRIEALRVISRTSAMMYKGAKKTAPVIAQELGVRFVLEGSVRRAGNSLRISAQLIDSARDAHLWAEKYSGTLEDVFDLQEKLSGRIVEGLRGKLTPEDARRLAAHTTTDPRVYEVWLRARQEGWQLSQERVENAIRLVAQALDAFGDHALLHAANGIFNWMAYDFGFSHTEETLARSESSAKRALELKPDLALAWYSRGLGKYKRGDMLGFVRDLRHAVGLERNSETLFFLSFTLAEIGRIDEARVFADQALERDPLSWTTPFCRSAVDLFDGKFDAALIRIRSWTTGLTDATFSKWWLGQALAYAGHEDEAVAAFEQGARAGPGLFSELCEMGARSFRGERDNARAWFDSREGLRQAASSDEYYPKFLAVCFARIKEYDLTLRSLEQAIRWGFTNYRFLSEHDRFLAPLRGDPRFEALVERARAKEVEFEI